MYEPQETSTAVIVLYVIAVLFSLIWLVGWLYFLHHFRRSADALTKAAIAVEKISATMRGR